MTGVFKTVTFFFVLAFAAVVVYAEDYDVGDDTDWTLPTDMEFYNTWAAGKTFRVGDELEFEFAAGRHDVAVVTQEAYENCDKMKPLSLMKTPPVKIMLNKTGPQYFICTIGEHCRFGQKLAIEVVAGPGGAGSGGTTPAPSGGGVGPVTPGTTPTTPAAGAVPVSPAGTTTPPAAASAASSLGGVTFLATFVSAVVALF